MQELTHVPVDNSWFLENQDSYLSHDDFMEFAELSGVRLDELVSGNKEIRLAAQEKIASQSIVLNAIRETIGDYLCPLVCTHELMLCPSVSNHKIELDKKMFSLDMADSLRRRHFAISFSIAPSLIELLSKELGRPLTVKNLGSGMGIDMINTLCVLDGKANEYIEAINNYDMDNGLLDLGRKITASLENKNQIACDLMHYDNKNLFMNRERSDLVLLVGIICGLTDEFATSLLSFIRKTMNEGGAVIVSSSNHHMRDTDPCGSFIIQNIGLAGYDPMWGWPLNYRTDDQIRTILENAGFNDINVYDDANFPNRQLIDDKIMNQVDCLPSMALGWKEFNYVPYALPRQEVLEKKVGYNWIVVARKA